MTDGWTEALTIPPLLFFFKLLHSSTATDKAKKADFFHISQQNICYGYSLEAPR